MKQLAVSVFALFGVLVYSASMLACPCGCGAVGPLVLSPGETWKFKVGLTKDYNRNLIDQSGNVGLDDGPSQTDKYSFGLANSLSERLAVSGQWSYERNFHASVGSHYSFGDPSVGLRYTFFAPGAFEFFMPTLQFHLTYKHANAKGLLESADREHAIDIHGNSFSEVLPGVDAWFTRLNWTFGLGLAGVFRRPVNVQDEEGTSLHEKGSALKTQFSLSYTYFGTGQVLVAIEREEKDQDRRAGEKIANSESLRHSLDLTTNLRVGIQKTLAMSVQRSGYDLGNRNTARKEAFSLSYLQTI